MTTKFTDVWVTGVRADYKKRKIVITIEVMLTKDNAAILGPIAAAAQSDRPMEVEFTEQQSMFPTLQG
jgi:hypothetical protein